MFSTAYLCLGLASPNGSTTMTMDRKKILVSYVFIAVFTDFSYSAYNFMVKNLEMWCPTDPVLNPRPAPYCVALVKLEPRSCPNVLVSTEA